MSFYTRTKSGFNLQEDTFKLIMHNKILWLYWFIPALLLAFCYLMFYPSTPLYSSAAYLSYYLPYPLSFIFLYVPIILVQAAFVIHVARCASDSSLSLKEVIRIVPPLLPSLVMWAFIEKIFVIIPYFSPTLIQRPLVMILTELIWRFFSFYGLVLIVLERNNPIQSLYTSVIISAKSFIEIITGSLCIRIILIIIGAVFIILPIELFSLLMKTALTEKEFFAEAGNIILSPAVLTLTTTFQVLTYRWYKSKKDIINSIQ